MAMYECKNCGMEESTFPGVMLAINPPEPTDDACDMDFDHQFNYLHRQNVEISDPNFMNRKALEKTWNDFYIWLGLNHLIWFCSTDCATNYLVKIQNGEE